MKKMAMVVLLLALAFASWIFFFRLAPKSEREFRANLTDAQKMLVTLRGAETAYQQSQQAYQYVSATRKDRNMVYSEGWVGMRLPNVDANAGFDYECLPPEGVCQALESGKLGPNGNGIRIDIESGVYSCLGAYKPVMTEGFDGTRVTVACQAA